MRQYIVLIIINIIYITTAIPSWANSAIYNADDDKPGKIKGFVMDEKSGQPLEFANIALYSLNDSLLITGTISGEKGDFEMEGLTYGEYYLVAHFIGFDKENVREIIIKKENPVVEPLKIELSPTNVEIGAVEVVADKAAIEYKLDKKVVNVSQVVNAAGGTAVDVLENTPSVQVDIEGNVSLRGSVNFTVLIDGRPSVLSGSDALRQIPASALENIEIITNPSAKYEPDGNSGIINLVMKKNSLNGFSGIVNATVGSGDKYRGDFTINYRTEKFSLFAGADWRDETNYGSMVSERETYLTDTTAFLDMNGSRDYIRGGHNFKSGIELFLSPKTTFTFSGELGKSKSTTDGKGKTHAYTMPVSQEIFSVSEETSARENDFYSVNLNLQHNFNTEGHKIEAMVFYSGEKGTDNEEESEILADGNYMKTSTYLDRVSTLETEDEKEFRFKLDYTNPFSESGRLEAGLYSRIDGEVESMVFEDFDQTINEWITNDLYSSTTDFRREIHAVYATFSNKIVGLQYMAGLRGELTFREIQNTNLAETSKLNRFDVFPTLHLSHPIKESNELMASYSRRINRPSGRDLDPSPGYWNRYTIRFGNPDLKPEYTDSYELGFMKRFGRSYTSLDAFHRVTNNKIDRIETLGEDGIFTSRPDNFDNDYATGLELTGNVNFTKWLMVNASTSMYNYRISGQINGDNFDRESTNWSGRMNTTVKFSENSRMQITGYYRGPSVSAQGDSKAMFYSNISYRQEFWNRKLSATLSIQDPLGTAKYERESYSDDFKSYFKWAREPRVVRLTLSYKINNFNEDRRNGGSDGGMDMSGGEF